MGNTECVINSQNPNGPEECIFGTGFDAYGNPISGSTWQFTDPLKVNEYVSWYLNGVVNNPAEYGLVDDTTAEGREKIVNYPGILRKLLSHRSQRDFISGNFNNYLYFF